MKRRSRLISAHIFPAMGNVSRFIAQLTERQIVDALRASGFAEHEVEIYRHKLLNRRDQMLRDLGRTNSASP